MIGSATSRPGRPLRMLGWLVGSWVMMRLGMLLMPVLGGIGAHSEQERYVEYRSLRDHGGGRAAPLRGLRDIAGPDLPRARSVVAVTEASGGGGIFGAGSLPGLGWSNQTAEVMLGSAVGFARPRSRGGLLDRLAQIVAGSEGRVDALSAGADLPIGAGSGISPAPAVDRPGRWSGTAWMLWRPDVGGSFAAAPLLGGSQAGARLDYRLTSGSAGQLSLYGRVSRALTGRPSEEGALGVAFRPGRLPVSLLAERRQRLGPGGRSGFALLVAGGIGPREIAPRVEAESYVQAGIVGSPGANGFADGFADGKASLAYRLTPADQRRSLSLGASVSGSVQPGAGRIDVGPELRLRLPLGTGSLRLSTEWRERIAGEARPARGPAVTLVAGF